MPPTRRPATATPTTSQIVRSAFADALTWSALPVRLLPEEEPVEVLAERQSSRRSGSVASAAVGWVATLVGLSRSRTASHCRTNRSMSACSAGGSLRVQLHQIGHLVVGRRQQGRVERAEEA